MVTLDMNESIVTLDLRGLNCPVPVLKTKQAFDRLAPGGELLVEATDPGSESDIDSWAGSIDDAELIDQSRDDSGDETIYTHHIRKEG